MERFRSLGGFGHEVIESHFGKTKMTAYRLEQPVHSLRRLMVFRQGIVVEIDDSVAGAQYVLFSKRIQSAQQPIHQIKDGRYRIALELTEVLADIGQMRFNGTFGIVAFPAKRLDVGNVIAATQRTSQVVVSGNEHFPAMIVHEGPNLDGTTLSAFQRHDRRVRLAADAMAAKTLISQTLHVGGHGELLVVIIQRFPHQDGTQDALGIGKLTKAVPGQRRTMREMFLSILSFQKVIEVKHGRLFVGGLGLLYG